MQKHFLRIWRDSIDFGPLKKVNDLANMGMDKKATQTTKLKFGKPKAYKLILLYEWTLKMSCSQTCLTRGSVGDLVSEVVKTNAELVHMREVEKHTHSGHGAINA